MQSELIASSQASWFQFIQKLVLAKRKYCEKCGHLVLFQCQFFFHSKKNQSDMSIQTKGSSENYTFDLNNMFDIQCMVLSRRWTHGSIECFLFEYWAGNLWGVYFCMKTKRHSLYSSQYLNFLVLTATKQFRATGFFSHFSHFIFHSLFGFHTKMVCLICPREIVELLHKKYAWIFFFF